MNINLTQFWNILNRLLKLDFINKIYTKRLIITSGLRVYQVMKKVNRLVLMKIMRRWLGK